MVCMTQMKLKSNNDIDDDDVTDIYDDPTDDDLADNDPDHTN